MVDVARVTKLIGKLSILKFFPGDPAGQAAIVELACRMATNTEQIEWLVPQMLTWYNEWPGPREMRAVFCQRFKPADGGPNVNCSTFFPDGVFPGCAMSGLPAAKVLTTGEVMERRRIETAEARKMLAIAAKGEER